MQPLDPNVRKRILAKRLEVTPEDIDEYERLQAARFRRDPSAVSPATLEAVDPDSLRLEELRRKIFGGEGEL